MTLPIGDRREAMRRRVLRSRIPPILTAPRPRCVECPVGQGGKGRRAAVDGGRCAYHAMQARRAGR